MFKLKCAAAPAAGNARQLLRLPWLVTSNTHVEALMEEDVRCFLFDTYCICCFSSRAPGAALTEAAGLRAGAPCRPCVGMACSVHSALCSWHSQTTMFRALQLLGSDPCVQLYFVHFAVMPWLCAWMPQGWECHGAQWQERIAYKTYERMHVSFQQYEP